MVAIGHPADVYFFREFINRMCAMGHDVTVIAREKEMTFCLLEKFEINYINISIHKKALLSKILNYIVRLKKVYAICKNNKPDVSIGLCDFILPQISKFLDFKSVVITDMEYAFHDSFLTYPFASLVLTPKSFKKSIGEKQIRFNSYKEFAYINQNFQPDKSILHEIRVKEHEKYIVLRFVSHSAAHDFGYTGLSTENKVIIVNEFQKYAKVFISSEVILSKEIEQYRLKIAPEKIHDVLYYASLLYGESSTMAAESACMGVPAIFIDNNGRGYTDELEHKYNLLFNYALKENQFEESINKGIALLHRNDGRNNWNLKKEKMIQDKESMTDFLVKQVLNISIKKNSLGKAQRG